MDAERHVDTAALHQRIARTEEQLSRWRKRLAFLQSEEAATHSPPEAACGASAGEDAEEPERFDSIL